MPLLGAHQSTSGGYYKAVQIAANFEMDCVQIFTKSGRTWNGREITDQDVELFRNAITETGIQFPCSHASYLINLATPNDELWEKSINGMIVELQRAERLGLVGVVMHPGSYVDSSEEAGLERVVTAFNRIQEATADFQVQTWVEGTAGQGTNLGHRFEHLASIVNNVEDKNWLGICLDTCHLFAAGYSLSPLESYEQTMQEFDEIVGFHRLRAFHLNDSKHPLGSRKDRHETIGEGELGLEGFRPLMNDARFEKLPMYLETPKGKTDDGTDLDALNLSRLRSLIS